MDLADVDIVAGHADRVVLAAVGHKVVLGEEVFALHLAGFADVKLVRPAAGVGELVLADAPLRIFLPNALWHRGVVLHEIDKPVRPIEVLLPDFLAPFRLGVRIILVRPAQVE